MNEKQAIVLLKKHSTDEKSFDEVLKHSLAVQKIALEIAERYDDVDVEFIRIGCILHDIGRFSCPPGEKTILHGIEGGKILRKEGLPRFALVAERHLGSGITKEAIKEQNLAIPAKDYVPESMEEKIITAADNLVDGDKRITIEEEMKRYEKELGKKYAEGLKKLYDEVMKNKKNINKL